MNKPSALWDATTYPRAKINGFLTTRPLNLLLRPDNGSAVQSLCNCSKAKVVKKRLPARAPSCPRRNRALDRSMISASREEKETRMDFGPSALTNPVAWMGGSLSNLAPVLGISPLGWAATYPSPPPAFDPHTTPEILTVTRQGFDASGVAITFDQEVTVTARVREPYPNQGTLTADTVALSEPIFVGDTINGVVNNSTLVAPKPVCAFSRPDHTLVGDTLEVAIVAFTGMPDAAGETVAAVIFEATDGINTVTQTVTEMSVSDWGVNDAGGAVLEYAAALDVSSLNDNAEITVNARAYPHVGSAYADSSRNADVFQPTEGSNRRWSPQYFLRHTAHMPIYAYVDPVSGDDGAGVTSTTPNTAEAAPFATIAAAADAIQAADGARVDGHVIRLMAGTHAEWGGATASASAVYSYLTIERDPNAAREAVILQSTSDAGVLDVDYLKFSGITLQRTGDNQFDVPAGNTRPTSAIYSFTWVHDCVVDNIGYTGTTRFFSTSYEGAWTQNACRNIGRLFDTQKQFYNLLRGNDFEDAATGVEMSNCFGNRFAVLNTPSPIPDVVRDDGAIIAFNAFYNCEFPVLYSTAAISHGVAIVQNLIEVTGASDSRGIQWGAESSAATEAQNNVIFLHNTVAAQGDAGRVNLFYDDDPGTTHWFTNTYLRSNCFGQLNIKTDVFDYTQNSANVGNWQARYGAGCSGNWTQSTEYFNQEFAGLHSDIPPGDSIYSGYNFDFVDYQAVTDADGSSPVAGAGGGDYRLTATSRGHRGAPRALPFDLSGVPRGAVTDPGCYEGK